MPDAILNRAQEILENPLTPVNQVETISHEDFNQQHILKNKPVLITNMMDSWKATDLWSLDYFEKIGKNKETFSYQGNIRQNDTNWQYGEFIDYLNEIKNYENSKTNTYLGNMSIAELFPELMQHVDFSLLSKNVVRNSTSLWIGPPGTITGFHTDRLANNILALIKGRKLVFLVNPKENKYMHTSDKYEPGSKLSHVNLEKFDTSKTPLFKKAHVQYAVIHPGQMLFIPQNWWHCVYGLDITISSNNFAFKPWDNFKMKFSEFTKRNLHKVGLYGTRDCVCHYFDENGKRHKR
ncbi:MAG: cupin-like domain-containing protein [Bacteroidia bacterium]|nr:cupin-like domain-containing protein [Bacteroidia bacterium]NND25807.1 cupin-like domain-containing protein [Flavobacteriaceae bacterium]MBT8278431.1 cupin-like domain-containing protein [Bacteroidia bacterium]NNK60135.1 cupin-like domain-containing protein [Flavobacteriaceae bacterium]NNL33491.1 cupin-like domain-containing protein [Flavobacteriaceae bacterium]